MPQSKSTAVWRRPLFHKVNLPICKATDILARQVQKSVRINSDRQSGSDQLGSNKKRELNKIKLDTDQLGS